MGPCTGWWYVTSSSLKVQRETVINKYIKSTGPALGGMTFQQANASCYSGDFVTAIKDHEYRGTPPIAQSWEGHQGRIEYMVQVMSPNADAKNHIEGMMARNLSDLKDSVNSTVASDETYLLNFADSDTDMQSLGPNWGPYPTSLGQGRHNVWTGSAWTSDCNGLPEQF